jgi:hypothetical protein
MKPETVGPTRLWYLKQIHLSAGLKTSPHRRSPGLNIAPTHCGLFSLSSTLALISLISLPDLPEKATRADR